MQTVIDLWNGNISPFERCGAQDPEAKHLISLMERNRETLQKGLTAAQVEILQKYMILQRNICSGCWNWLFTMGFAWEASWQWKCFFEMD